MHDDLNHVGLHVQRLASTQNNPREVAFAAEWRKQNSRNTYTAPTLRGLMTVDCEFKDSDSRSLGHAGYQRQAHQLDQRDAEIVATVMQWLGSNIGMEFLQNSLNKCGYEIIKK